MENKDFNPAIKAIVSIRNVVSELSTEHERIKSLGKNLDSQLDSAENLLASKGKIIATVWTDEKNSLNKNVNKLQSILGTIYSKIKNKEAGNLAEIWNEYKIYSTSIENSYKEMQQLGSSVLTGDELKNWKIIWKEIFSTSAEINNIAEEYGLKLSMIDQLKPKEIDELTDQILKYIPRKYTHAEALQYEKEYMIAYNELKEEASKKKNLWDKFLDLLAGGVQETPENRVMMRRWMEGDL